MSALLPADLLPGRSDGLGGEPEIRRDKPDKVEREN
jgi:hypothetical protein